MKKKIISSILAVAMMASIAVPSVFAANSDVAGSYAKVTKITEKEGKDTWTIEVGEANAITMEDKINVYENETKLVLDKGQIRYELNGPTGEYNGFKFSADGKKLIATQANREAVLTVYDNYNKSTTNARVDIKIKSVESTGGGPAESFTFKTAANELPITVDTKNGVAEEQTIVVQSHPKGSVFSDADLTKFKNDALPQIAAALLGSNKGVDLVGSFDQYSTSARGIFEVDYNGVGIETYATYTYTATAVANAATVVTFSDVLADGNDLAPSLAVGDAAATATAIKAAFDAEGANSLYSVSIAANGTDMTFKAKASGVVTAPTAVSATVANIASPVFADNNTVTVTASVLGSMTSAPIVNTDGAYVDANAIAKAIATANASGAANGLTIGGKKYFTTMHPTLAGVVVFTATDDGKVVPNTTIPDNGTLGNLTLADTGSANSKIVTTSAYRPVVAIKSLGGTNVANATVTYDFNPWLNNMPAVNTDIKFNLDNTPSYRVGATDTNPAALATAMAVNFGTGKFTNWTASSVPGSGILVLTHKTTGVVSVPTASQLSVTGFATGSYYGQNIGLTAVRQENNTEIKVTIPQSFLNSIYNNTTTAWGKVVGARNDATGTYPRILDKSFVINVTMGRFDSKVPGFTATTNATYTEAIKAVSWQVPQMNYEIEVGQTIKIPVTYYPPQANVLKKATFEPASVLNNGKPFMYATIEGDTEVGGELKILGVNSTETAKTNFKGQVKEGVYTAFFSVAVKPTTYKPSGTPEFTSKISTTALEVEAGKIAPVTISNLPQGVTVKWTHKDDGTMGINKNEGPAVVVTGKKVGTNVLTASLSNGEKFDVAVTVKAATVTAPAPGTGNGGSTNVPQTGDSLFANLF